MELDWYKVLGYRAVIYGNNSWNPAQSRATATTPAVFFGDVTTEEVSGKKTTPPFHLVSDGIGSPYNPYCFNIYLRGIYIYIYIYADVRALKHADVAILRGLDGVCFWAEQARVQPFQR